MQGERGQRKVQQRIPRKELTLPSLYAAFYPPQLYTPRNPTQRSKQKSPQNHINRVIQPHDVRRSRPGNIPDLTPVIAVHNPAIGMQRDEFVYLRSEDGERGVSPVRPVGKGIEGEVWQVEK